MGDYQRLQTDAETEIIAPIEPKSSLSIFQRLLFVASCILTIAVVVTFIWGLPCDLDSCKAQQHSITWDKTLYGLELKGRMHLVGGHLVCILRAALWGRPSPGFPPHTGGVIALSATTGDTVWYVPLPITPIHIDCTLLGSRRCLILGDKGFLAAIDYISGIHVWKMKSQNTSIFPQPEEIDFPLTVPGRGELITLARFKIGGHRLLFVSMDSGVIVSEPPVSSECYHVYNLTYSINEETLHYTCSNILGGGTRIMPYKLSNPKNKRGKDVGEPIDYNKRMKEDVIHGERQVVVSNTGSCPRTSNAIIVVTDSTNATIWTYSADKTYALAPLPLRFRPQITGFLIKLWQWQERVLNSTKSISFETIKERIVLITFNRTGSMHVVNASQTDIMQVCNEENECQPQLSFQTQSALLVDVNGDGRQDLISYFVTYKPLNEDEHNPELHGMKDWELQSKVRVVLLEAELPKLYRTQYLNTKT